MATELWYKDQNLMNTADDATAIVYKDTTVGDELDSLNENLAQNTTYSTEEKVVGTWIDGKPLYRKCIKIPKLSNTSGMTTYSHNISNLDSTTKLYGIAKSNSSGSVLPLPFVSFTNSAYIVLSSDSTNINIQTGADRSTLEAVIVMEYTKTID